MSESRNVEDESPIPDTADEQVTIDETPMEQIKNASDDWLIELTARQAHAGQTHGWGEARIGFQAQAELIRRLTVQLAN
jgi:hypothetical protein